MILVSYIDILDYIGDDRQCLIEGEEVFNQSNVENVNFTRRVSTNVYEVSAICVCKGTTPSEISDVCIEISQTERKKFSSKCSCDSYRKGKCRHVAATLIHLHRYPPVESKSTAQTNLENGTDVFVGTKSREKEKRSPQLVRLKRKSSNDRNSIALDDSQTVIVKEIKSQRSEKDLVSDPSWDKENDCDEDEAFEWAQSSDEDWEPAERKRPRPHIPLHPAKVTKDFSKNRKNKKCTIKATADHKPKELATVLQDVIEDGTDEELPNIDPLQCLLCEVVAVTRLEMRNHYLLAHDKDSVVVCDRCGEFRQTRDHICASQLSFYCRLCQSPFKTGRDYWNHLIRSSRKHADLPRPRGGGRWRCGWARCEERFSSEDDLLAHARLHLPVHVQLMCGVCMLVLRNTDSKVVHMEKHEAGVYECGACRQGFVDKTALRAHWDVHATERPHLCDICGWRFVTPAALQAHVRKCHEGGPFCCAKCPQKFDDRTDVRVHFGAAHGSLRCAAAHCSFRCANKASLDRHVALAHVDDDDPDDPRSLEQQVKVAACSACSETFSSRRELRAHVRDAHAGARVECSDCGKAFKGQRDLDEHRRAHTGEKPFICAECGMTFKRAQNLEYHTKGAHKNERNFVCPECGKRFISNADMKRHLRYSHQDGKKWHLCPECGHRLPSLYNLKLHVQSRHTGERPHKCSQCDMGFVASSDLKKHIMFKHNKEHPFACEHCDKRYQRRRDLDVHVKRHHGGALHVCAACGKGFDTYASMMQHSRYHTTEEAFQCAECGRRFPHRMNLSRHLCLPDIKKNHRCQTCGLSFTTSGSLKSHRRRLHAGEEPQADSGRAAHGEKRPKQASKTQAETPPLAQEQQDQQLDRNQHDQQHQQLLPHQEHQQQQHDIHPQPQLQPQPQQEHPAYMPRPTPPSPSLQRSSVVLQSAHHHTLHEEAHRQQHLLHVHQHDQTPRPLQQAVVVTQHMEPGSAVPGGYEDYSKQDKLWRGQGSDAWALAPVGPAAPVASSGALASEETILSLAGCATYHELESAQPVLDGHNVLATDATPPPAAPTTVLRYEPAAATTTTTTALVVKSEPPPLIALSSKGDQTHMMYASAAGPAPTAVKLVSTSQPPPLASLSSGLSGQSSLILSAPILGAPIQTTADGSFHLVFVPHGQAGSAAK